MKTERTAPRVSRSCDEARSDQVRERKQLQDDNGKLKRLVAERRLEKTVLQDVLGEFVLARAELRTGELCYVLL